MLTLDTGEFTFRITSHPANQDFIESFKTVYEPPAYESVKNPVDFEVALKQEALIRRFFKPQVTFFSDQQAPFKPMPLSQAYPVLEWGMNWCIAAYDFNRFLVHAAALEKDGKAIIFPASPGSGKSTLTAYLSQNGWHLFSDEMAIIDIGTNKISPMYRPISLKNNSIDLVKSWFPDQPISKTAVGTQKGDVALFRGIDWKTHISLVKTKVVGIIFPKFDKKIEETTIVTMTQMQAFQQLAENAFNYNILGIEAFETVKTLIANSKQFEIHYNNVSAVNQFLIEEFI